VPRGGNAEIVVRADKGRNNADTRKPIVTVDFSETAYYRVFAKISYSADQINESYFIDVCGAGELFCIPPCDPNVGGKKLVVDDNGPFKELLIKDSGIVLIPAGIWTFHLNHFIDIAGEFPEKWNCYPTNPACKADTGIVVDNAESVHLRELIIVRVPDVRYDLSLTKRADRLTVFPGQEIEYTLTLTNEGNSIAKGIRVVDLLPDSVAAVEDSATPPFSSLGPKRVVWEFNELAVGDTLAVTYRARVSSNLQAFPDTLVNSSRVTALCDTIAANNPAQVTVTVLPPPQPYDLELRKTADVDTVVAGGSFSYTLEIVNSGRFDAKDVTVRDAMPPFLDVVSVFPQPAVAIDSDTLVWLLPVIQVGDTATIQLNMSVDIDVDLPASPFSRLNVSWLEAADDTNAVNNRDSVVVHLKAKIRNYDLSVQKRVLDERAVWHPGDEIPYRVEVVNLGIYDAREVSVWDVLPDSFVFVAATPEPLARPANDTLFWPIPQLAVGDTFAIDLRARVLETLELPDSLRIEQVNRTWISAAKDTNAANDQDIATVSIARKIEPYDLQLTKTVSRSAAHPGDALQYRIDVVNLGVFDAFDVAVRDILPDSLEFVSAAPPVPFADTLLWHVPMLAVGDTFRIDVAMRAPESILLGEDGYEQRNVSWVEARDDTNAANDRDSVVVQISERPRAYDLQVSKRAVNDAPRVYPGDTVEYSIDVVNLGPREAFDFALHDLLPDSLDLISTDPFTQVGDTLSWRVASLAVGDTFRVAVGMQVPDDIVFDVREFEQMNVGWVDAADDTNAANDRDSVAITVRDFTTYDLQLTKTARPDTVFQGETFSYTLEITNFGPDTANSIALWDVFPQQVSILNVSLQPVSASDADTVFWQISELAPGSTQQITVSARVSPNAGLGDQPVSKQNSARVIGQFDNNPANDFATATIVCLPPPKFDCIVLDRNVFEPEHIQPGLGRDLNIAFELAEPGFVEINLYDISGYLVTNLASGDFRAGANAVAWNGSTQDGQKVGSGVYIIFFRYNNVDCIEKVIIAR